MHNFFRTLAPEQFDAKVTIRADGSYTYSYDGVLISITPNSAACPRIAFVSCVLERTRRSRRRRQHQRRLLFGSLRRYETH